MIADKCPDLLLLWNVGEVPVCSLQSVKFLAKPYPRADQIVLVLKIGIHFWAGEEIEGCPLISLLRFPGPGRDGDTHMGCLK